MILKLKKIDKDLPYLAFYINLTFARKEHQNNKEVDYFVKIFEMGIKKKYYQNEEFWKMLL